MIILVFSFSLLIISLVTFGISLIAYSKRDMFDYNMFMFLGSVLTIMSVSGIVSVLGEL